MSSAQPHYAPDRRLVLAFADMAAARGWSPATLRAFCAENGISADEQLRRWPEGVRTLGRELNAWADAATFAECERAGPQPLSLILLRRFEANERYKSAVRSLARSDLLHPIDTLRRTAASAALFLRVQDRPLPAPSVVCGLKTGLLVVLYSACVLVWLTDTPPVYRKLRRAIQSTAFLMGTR